MKVLLIQPSIEDFYQTAQRIEPIGLAYLAASLQERGFSPQILDCQANRKKSILDLPPSLQYLKDFYLPGNLSPFKLFGHFYHFGLALDEIEREIRLSGARIFGISTMFSTYHHQALSIAERIKKVDRSHLVILGGSHVSAVPAEVLDHPYVDYVILGEGEESLPLLLESLSRGDLSGLAAIDGIGYRESGMVRIHPKTQWVKNLDALPFPARELLPAGAYRIGARRSTKILASRGCPCGCAFCSVQLGMGARFRQRSAGKILQEMAYCHEELGIQAFDFEDDHLGYDPDAFHRLLDRIIEHFGERKLRLYAMNGIFPAVLTRPILEKMKRAGFESVHLTFASRDERIRATLGRADRLDDFLNAMTLAQDCGLQVTAYVFLGVPGQTLSGMMEDLLFLAGQPCLIGPSIFYPVSGTALFHRVAREGLFDPSDYVRLRSPAFPIETEEFSRKDIFTLFYLARLLNFMKSVHPGSVETSGTLGGIFSSAGVANKSAVGTEVAGNERTSEMGLELKGDQLISDGKLYETEAGMLLLKLFFQRREIFGLRLIKRSGKSFQYQVYRENCSEKALEMFFSLQDAILPFAPGKLPTA